MNVIETIIQNILNAFYHPFISAILLSFMAMFAYLYAKDNQFSIYDCMIQWLREFKSSKKYRRIFILFFYIALVLFRTLLNRTIWLDPLGKIMDGWTLYTKQGELTTEAIENFVLLIPYTFLLLNAFKDELLKQHNIFYISFKYSLRLSLSIETLQVLFYLGTFQVADLVYNTLGGLVGGLIYVLYSKISKEEVN